MTASKLPASYREQRACANCARVFRFSEYDEGEYYYCTLNAPPRPKCGSHFMDEDFPLSFEDRPVYDAQSKAWDEWSEGRSVKPHGTCDEHEART